MMHPAFDRMHKRKCASIPLTPSAVKLNPKEAGFGDESQRPDRISCPKKMA